MIAKVYSLNYDDYLNLPLYQFFSLYSHWQLSAGLSSGTEVFNVVSKEWVKLLNPRINHQPKPFEDDIKPKQGIRAILDKIKKEKGVESVNLKSVMGLLSSRNS